MIAVGNWKMNTTLSEAIALAEGLVAQLGDDLYKGATVGVAPPFPFLEAVGRVLGDRVELIAQDCHPAPKGAFTSAVSVGMLASVGVKRVIVGHSERRKHFGDDDARVSEKVKAVLAGGLDPILCVGETLEQREAGQAEAVVQRQTLAGLAGLSAADLARTWVAYEPVWAIGTGKTATPTEVQAMHTFLREQVLPEACGDQPVPPVLYGGSVKPTNIDALAATPHVGGVLVGGASLEASSFARIVQGCAENGAE